MESSHIEETTRSGVDPLQNIYSQYVKDINTLRKQNKLEELEELIERVVHLLPSNVTSLTIPVFGGEEPTYITSEREISQEEGEAWSFGNLIAYSLNLDKKLTTFSGD